MTAAVIGATGFVGTAIVNELAQRGVYVRAISRNPGDNTKPNVEWTAADVFETDSLTNALQGADVVISAYNPGWSNPNIYDDFLRGSRSIQQAVRRAGISRFIVIGGAGSLYLPNGSQVIDSSEFPAEIRPGATAARDYLNELKSEEKLDWAFFSPAIEMHQGIQTGRTGQYRLGKDQPLFNDENRSILSVEDLAVVIADEAQNSRHHRERFTAAY